MVHFGQGKLFTCAMSTVLNSLQNLVIHTVLIPSFLNSSYPLHCLLESAPHKISPHREEGDKIVHEFLSDLRCSVPSLFGCDFQLSAIPNVRPLGLVSAKKILEETSSDHSDEK